MPPVRSSLLIAVLAIAPALSAQTATDTTRHPIQVAPLVVTADRRPTTASDATALVRVIDSAAIARRAASDLPTILRDVPGIQADPVVGSGLGVSLEGLGSDRVLVLLDGAPLTGRLDGQFDLSRVNPALLARVEVVDGPQSTLYGSDALGGVVNLITRRDYGRRVELSSQGGSNGQWDQRGRLSGGSGLVFGSLDLGHRSADVVPGGLAKNGGLAERWDGMARVSAPLFGGSADLRIFGVDETQRYRLQGMSGPETDNNANKQLDALATLALGTDGNTEIRLHGSSYDHLFTASTGSASDADRENVADVEGLRRGRLGQGTWLAGAKLERDGLTSDRIAGGARNGVTGALFGSGEAAVSPGIRLSAGIRFTDSDLWGSDIAPRANVLIAGPAGFGLKLGGARGFRAPSFKEQFLDFTNTDFGYTVKGDPTLVPESSWNLTGEIGRSSGPRQIYVRGYQNWISNLIVTELVDPATFTFQYHNVDRAQTRGLEVGGAWTAGIVTARGNYVWLHTEDETTGKPIDGNAAETGRIGLTAAPGALAVTGELIATSHVLYDQPDGSVIGQGAYKRVNLSASYALGAAKFVAGADNLFDTIPANATMFLGRRWYAGLTWGFGW
ncbi:MAG: TonB-dependent receptor plug domain-containing protein [Gemmatimonadales bacterium]